MICLSDALAGGLNMRKFLVFLCFLYIGCYYVEGRKKVDVYVAGFFPVGVGPKQTLGRGVMPALNLAVRHVNEHPTILRNYKLHVVWNDTKCNTAIGTKAFFDMMYKAPRKVMLFGSACTHVTDTIVKAARHWHITQLSYADTHPMFSAIKYPNFFRMAPSDKEFNMPRIHLLRHFNWTRVGTLFQNEPRHALSHNHLVSLLDKLGDFDIVDTQSFADDLEDQLTKLLDQDVRIILGYFDEKWARRIFCEAFKKGMYGKNFQWIITGMYRERWWTLSGDGHDATSSSEDEFGPGEGKCMVEEIMTALEGCVMIDLLPLATSDNKTVSGKNITQYEEAYTRKRGNEYSRFHGYTYDGVWAMALAIQAVGHKLHKRNHVQRTNTTVQDFVYRDPKWEELFTTALSEVQFEGVTGHVQFTKDNTRNGYILLKQFQDGKEVKIGEYDGFRNLLELEKGHAIYWPGGNPPLDRTVKVVEKSSVNIRIYAILVTLASLGIVAATIFLSINIHFRNQRYIKMSSPYLNNLIIIGCIFTYTSVILLGLDSGLTNENSFPVICTSRAWVLMSGFTLAFGSMFSKTWRVHSIFTNVQLNKKVIKDYQLYMVVFVLLSIDIAIMITWQFVDPFRRETKLMQPFMRGDIQVIPENEYCMSNHMTVFVGCIYAYKGLLMIFGCFLAWETRHVNIPALNDSKYIGMSVYNVVIMCIIGVPISYILSDEQDAMYLIISVFILFCTSGTLGLVFVPKMIELRRNPTGAIDKRILRPTLKPPKRNDSDSDVSDLHDQIKKAESDRKGFTKKLKDKEEELKALIEKFEEVSDGEPSCDDSKKASTSQPKIAQQIPPRTIDAQPINNLRTESVSVVAELSSGTDITSLSERRLSGAPSSLISATSTINPHISQQSILSQHHNQFDHLVSSAPPHSMNVDRSSSRRSQTMVSPEPITPREVPKSVSFRLDAGNVSPLEGVPMLHMTRPSSMSPQPPYHSSYPQSVSPQPPNYIPPYPPNQISPPPPPSYAAPALPQRRSFHQQDINVLEREGAAFGGYGGMYVHEYGGPMNPSLLQERTVSRGSVGYESGRSSRYEDRDAIILHAPSYSTGGYISPLPPDVAQHRSQAIIRGPEVPRRSSLKKPKTGVSLGSSNFYTPLNNEAIGDRHGTPVTRKPADLTIINNTVAQCSHKNINAHANLSATSSLVDSIPSYQHLNTLRRGSEPPRPFVGRNNNLKNRSFDDLGDVEQPYEILDRRSSGSRPSSRREDDRESARTISRARLRRDSFGEVVSSRRSPSQDSLELSRARSSPETDEIEGHQHPEDIWSCTASSRHSPSQDSLQRQDYDAVGRAASQESLGTVSSRGSVSGSLFSMASARSDIPPGHRSWRNRDGSYSSNRRPTNHGSSQGSYLNGDLGDGAASTDDIAHQAVREGFREPSGLHRTSSEPYYNFDSMDIPDGPLYFNHPGYQQQYEPETRTLGRHRNHSGLRGYAIEGGPGYTHSLRGRSRSVTRTRATTSSVAAAIAAARSKNRSDNALDHDTSILPIFQKLLSERQRSFSGQGRDYTMSSCPNITIKCDIVEYL